MRAALILLLPLAVHASGSGSLPPAGSGSSSRSSAPVVRQAPRSGRTAPAPAASGKSPSKGIQSFSRGQPAAPAAPPPRRRAAPRVPIVAGMQAGETSLAGVPSLLRHTYESGRQRLAEADQLMVHSRTAESGLRARDLRRRAVSEYRRAAAAFVQVSAADPGLYQAWNMLGYARRKSGSYQSSLQAYAMALRQKPGYGPAIEYRAEAHLALGRLDEVRDAYRQLFGSQPELAAELAQAIQAWLREEHPNIEVGALEDFRQWFQEREQLANQAGRGAEGEAWR